MSIKPLLTTILFATAIVLTSSAQTDSDCKRINSAYQKKVCSGVENNKASYIKDLMEKKSGEYTLNKTLEWTKSFYGCFYCEDEPGFRAGTILRKVVFEDALSVGFFFVYDARVNMNIVERDGRTLIDWVQDDTEKAFDAAFETENEQDKRYLIKQIRTGQKYFNIFRNNGAKFRTEL